MINRNVLFSSADYNMIKNVTRAGSLTISSAGVTVCSLVSSATSEISESQIALPSFETAADWRLICRLGFYLQLSIHQHA
jgi:hypothetical protein